MHDLPRCSIGFYARCSSQQWKNFHTPSAHAKTKQNKKIFHATSATASYKRFWEKCIEHHCVLVVDDKQEKLQVGHGWFYPAVPNTAMINSLWWVVVYLCVETCPVVSAHTKTAHIWPLYRLQHTKTPSLGDFHDPPKYSRLLALLPGTGIWNMLPTVGNFLLRRHSGNFPHTNVPTIQHNLYWWTPFWGHLGRQYDPMPTDNGKAPHTKVARLHLFYHLQQFPTSTDATYFTCIFCGPNSAHHWFLNTNSSCNLHTFEKILLCLSYLKKFRTAKKFSHLDFTFFFFLSSLTLLIPPSLSQFLAACLLPLPLHLYISQAHLQKFSGPAGPKGKRKKGKEREGRKENINTYNFRRPSLRAVVVFKARFWPPFPYIQLPLFNILSIHSHSLVVGAFFTSWFFFLQLGGSNSAKVIYNIHMFLRNLNLYIM